MSKASPEIILFIVSSETPSENWLKSPYAGGFPDLKPVIIIFRKMGPNNMVLENGIIISLKITGKKIYEYISKHYYGEEKFKLFWSNKNYFADESDDFGEIVPEDNNQLGKIGFKHETLLTAIQEGIYNMYLEKKKIMEEERLKNSFPIILEELFEGVESDTEEEKVEELKEKENKKIEHKPVEKTEKEKAEGISFFLL